MACHASSSGARAASFASLLALVSFGRYKTVVYGEDDRMEEGLCLALGVSAGTVIGALNGQLGMWIAIGAAVGMAVEVGLRRR